VNLEARVRKVPAAVVIKTVAADLLRHPDAGCRSFFIQHDPPPVTGFPEVGKSFLWQTPGVTANRL